MTAITSLTAGILKKLIGAVLEILFPKHAGTAYQLAVYCAEWFKKALLGLPAAKPQPIKKLKQMLFRLPSDFIQYRQLKKQELEHSTVESLCAGVIKNCAESVF